LTVRQLSTRLSTSAADVDTAVAVLLECQLISRLNTVVPSYACRQPGAGVDVRRLRRAAARVWNGVKGVVVGLYRHDCLGLAAQVAYSALFSLFPFLLFLQALASSYPRHRT